ncbi:hypothetical protein HZH66_002551 [Vespula vulgaris]|uniref:Uncharacterized protein n=1 Tax=Vespula vulgaris TaxID=7454 RepID=A0A834KNC5_VESVU|nr:hypothetical protein HZH66_002551 [Vespula vulgaris]
MFSYQLSSGLKKLYHNLQFCPKKILLYNGVDNTIIDPRWLVIKIEKLQTFRNICMFHRKLSSPKTCTKFQHASVDEHEAGITIVLEYSPTCRSNVGNLSINMLILMSARFLPHLESNCCTLLKAELSINRQKVECRQQSYCCVNKDNNFVNIVADINTNFIATSTPT